MQKCGVERGLCAIVAAGEAQQTAGSSGQWSVQAFYIADSKRYCEASLPVPPLPNGLCVDNDGQIFVVLRDGKIVCFGLA